MTKEDKEILRFINDPMYREMVLSRAYNEQDERYCQNIEKLSSNISELQEMREREITRIARSRWHSCANGKLLINYTEGKIQFGQSEALFSDLRGAEINIVNSYRVITTETGESKKKASVGGAIAGGFFYGPIGAVAGGVGLGKTKSDKNSVMNQIPTCTHLGVYVNIDGFISEILLLTSEVDQSSDEFTDAYEQAQSIISRLRDASKKPVPKKYLSPAQEASVKRIEQQIEDKQNELEDALNEKPEHAIPSMYKNEKFADLSDSDFLLILKEMDQKRIAEKEANEAAMLQAKAEKKAEKAARKEAMAQEKAEKRKEQKAQNEKNRRKRAEEKQKQATLLAIQKAQFEEDKRAKADAQAIQKKQAELNKRQKAKEASDMIAIKKEALTNSVTYKAMKKVGIILCKIFFWSISLFVLLLAIGSLTMPGALPGACVLFITALAVNPYVESIFTKKLPQYPWWIRIIILVVGFVAGILLIPTSVA